VRFVSGRWWRTMTEVDPQGAERSLDRFCETVGDARARRIVICAPRWANWRTPRSWRRCPPPTRDHGGRTNRDRQCDGPLPGNRYSVPPGLAGSTLEVHQRLGGATLGIRSAAGAVLATHRLAHDGAGVVVRDPATAPRWSERCSVSSPRSDPATRRPRGISDLALVHAATLLGEAGEASVSTSRTTRDWRRRERELHLPVAAKSPQRPAPRDRGRGAAGRLGRGQGREARPHRHARATPRPRGRGDRATSTREPREVRVTAGAVATE